MKSFLVIGLGRFGRAVACELGSLGHEVLALDNSEENVQHIADSVTQAICGDAQDEAAAANPARRATSIKTRKSFSSGRLFMICVLCFTS